ncbi:Ca2+:Cation Antiporter (CaCA) Family Protein [Monocercomonoides exilis]|uniref:Ca2+:Cation Antiporter (CaCA) Family Protein n=1 Tax=Monocercomonoides exilis TaxID=2049356 RepID=UPI00355A44AE|nr:Ca2+:Cation Antiporter (CaCA) Family Protein [Monocercomonoides exilis]|eukprot:MONOS_928.1-p1 / transcript=MONOS_928.1 / gene=MONOS_928 / organism=Monocercomonoides_exilis_PA203 / gene_product=Ca2+:Cation Antiporter (CaCA) Family Protein / transcript_product=Ca2+:Cation Antiporter (CaCA) Family Protein / location=Mono_scaffold00015:160224-162840(-) / protein_length=775 / sequence_SO=supercontig / SO=protein_coding / is_pseudo=false
MTDKRYNMAKLNGDNSRKCSTFFLRIAFILTFMIVTVGINYFSKPQTERAILLLRDNIQSRKYHSATTNSSISKVHHYLAEADDDSKDLDTCIIPEGTPEEQCAAVKKNCYSFDSMGKVKYLHLRYCTLRNNVPAFGIISLLMLIAVLSVLLVLSDSFIVPSLLHISSFLGISDELAGITILAIGNATPDLFSQLASANTGSFSIALGESMGSTCYVVCFVLSVCILIRPVPNVPTGLMFKDLPFFLVVLIEYIMFVFCTRSMNIESAIVLMIIYVVYLVASLYVNKNKKRIEAEVGNETEQLEGQSSQETGQMEKKEKEEERANYTAINDSTPLTTSAATDASSSNQPSDTPSFMLPPPAPEGESGKVTFKMWLKDWVIYIGQGIYDVAKGNMTRRSSPAYALEEDLIVPSASAKAAVAVTKQSSSSTSSSSSSSPSPSASTTSSSSIIPAPSKVARVLVLLKCPVCFFLCPLMPSVGVMSPGRVVMNCIIMPLFIALFSFAQKKNVTITFPNPMGGGGSGEDEDGYGNSSHSFKITAPPFIVALAIGCVLLPVMLLLNHWKRQYLTEEKKRREREEKGEDQSNTGSDSLHSPSEALSNQNANHFKTKNSIAQLVSAIWMFLFGVYLVNIVSAEVVALIISFAAILNINSTFLGSTLLVWGSSLGDLVSDAICSLNGFPALAIAACLSSPLFQTTFGMAMSYFIHSIITHSVSPLPIPFHPHFPFLILCLGVVVVVLFVSAAIQGRVGRVSAVVLIVTYVLTVFISVGVQMKE